MDGKEEAHLPVEKAPVDDVGFEKRPGRLQKRPHEKGRVFPAFGLLFPEVGGVAVELPDGFAPVPVRVVKEMARELRGGIRARDFFMNTPRNVGSLFRHESQNPVASHGAVPNRVVFETVEATQVVGSGRTPDGLKNPVLQFRRDDLVGVEKENPIGGGRLDAEAALRGEVSVQGVLKHARAARSSDLRRSVRTEVVDNENFVGKLHGRKRTSERRRAVFRQNDDAETGGHSFSFGLRIISRARANVFCVIETPANMRATSSTRASRSKTVSVLTVRSLRRRFSTRQ